MDSLLERLLEALHCSPVLSVFVSAFAPSSPVWKLVFDIIFFRYSVTKGCLIFFLRNVSGGFPGGAVVKNLSAIAGDTGSSPGLGRPHIPRSSSVHQNYPACALEPTSHNY